MGAVLQSTVSPEFLPMMIGSFFISKENNNKIKQNHKKKKKKLEKKRNERYKFPSYPFFIYIYICFGFNSTGCYLIKSYVHHFTISWKSSLKSKSDFSTFNYETCERIERIRYC